VNDSPRPTEPSSTPPRRRRTFGRVLLWTGSIAGILFIGVLIAGDILLHHAGPILKAKVIETLSARFDSRVELDHFEASVVRGFEVYGTGLKLYPNHLDASEPLFQVDRFSFHVVSWKQLFQPSIFVNRVQVTGLQIHLPPKSQRPGMLPSAQHGSGQPHISILVGEILITRANLVIENGKPGKVPLQFIIDRIQLNSVGAGRPMQFHARLINPKPVGNINSSGDFGPFNAESPGDTPVRGQYTFRNADLNTIKGLGGILSSDGSYAGQLNNIVVDGQTSTPQFSLDIANHPVPLNTKFHAIVDGTNGDTHLEPVDAWLLHTHIVARGDVVRMAGAPGHDIRLSVTVDPGRIEDLLQLAAKTEPPLMTGITQLHTTFDLPPGAESVTGRLRLQGSFGVEDAHFTNPKFQSRLDQLSLRGSGHAEQAKQESDAMKNGNVQGSIAANAASEMRGNFTYASQKLTITTLNFRVPGADIALSGDYTLDGQLFNFAGTARLDAHVSQMVTGWKSWLLKPVDPFFAKNGAGTEVPIKITGTRSDPQVGLDFHH
jgi:hypothetical protein